MIGEKCPKIDKNSKAIIRGSVNFSENFIVLESNQTHYRFYVYMYNLQIHN